MAEVDVTTGQTDDRTLPLQPDKSLGELVAQVSSDFSELVHTQIELAKVEVKDEAIHAAKGAGMLGGAGVLGYLALTLLSFASAYGLGEIMPVGVGFLIVGLLWAGIAAALASTGRKQMKSLQPVPATQESLKEDVQWARQQMS